MKKISVIIPTYNSWNSLNKMLLKLCNLDIEIIVVDDGSTDNTEIKMNKIYSDISNIIYVKQINQGPGVARNAGISLSTGDIIFFFDSDDDVNLEIFQESQKIFANNDVDLIQFGYYTKKENEILKHSRSEEIIDNLNIKEKLAKKSLIDPYLWSKAFKKDIIGNIRFEKLYYAEDQVFLDEILSNVDHIFISDKSFYYYQDNPNSIVRGSFKTYQLDALKSMNILIDRNNDDYIKYLYFERKIIYIINFLNNIKSNKCKNNTDNLVFLKKLYKSEYNKFRMNKYYYSYTSKKNKLFYWSQKNMPFINYLYYRIKY